MSKLMKFVLSLTLFNGLLQAAIHADPVALRDDIEIRKVVHVSKRTMRLVKDPRDNTLYTMTFSGNISRINMVTDANRIGPRVARGRVNNDGDRTWSVFDINEVPNDVPLSAIEEAVDNEVIRGNDPTDNNQLYIVGPEGDILTPPRTVVVPAADHGLVAVNGFYIDAEGTFYLHLDVDAVNADSEEVIVTSADHGFNNVQGFDIGPDGTFYIGANAGQARSYTIAKGVVDDASGERNWSVIARTETFANGSKDHPHPAIVVSPDGKFVYLNSGSRTDHGEETGGFREAAISAAILRVPTDAEDVLIPADKDALEASGYKFADGFRNAFDMAFAPNGDLFAVDNGPDSDLGDEISWVREGHHYGFPWRMGGQDNPMRFADYDPARDEYILSTSSGAKSDGLFYNDPNFPEPPGPMSNPVINMGPDADRFRDPETGIVRDASDEGTVVYTFTPHSSPTGIVFDSENALTPEFRGDGFVFRIGGDCCNLINSFNDPDEDLLHLDLEKVGDNYQAHVRRIVEGFNGPIDAQMIGNKIYVVEWGGYNGLWEISLPMATHTAIEDISDTLPLEYGLGRNYPNPFNPSTHIPYHLGQAGSVELAIYDITGQKIRTLIHAEQAAGDYSVQWNGRNEAGEIVASGVYFSRLKASGFFQTRSLTLLK